MSECCFNAEPLLLGAGRPFSLPCDGNVSDVVSKLPCCSADGFSKASSGSPLRGSGSVSSLRRPKAIGLQRFNFALVHDNFGDCQTSHKQQLWQCSQATSDKTWERSSCGETETWSSISMSMPCLPISSTSGEPTHILPFLFLGSQHDALSEDVIRKNGITHVLNVSTSSPRSPFVSDANFLRIPVNDSHTDRLLPYFQDAFRFLDDVRTSSSSSSQSCVLVHCLAGISRSPTLVIAYIMHYLSLTSDDAYRFVKEKRPSISPNFNFLGQLVEFESLCQQLNNRIKQSTPRQLDCAEDCCSKGFNQSNCDDTHRFTSATCNKLPGIIEYQPHAPLHSLTAAAAASSVELRSSDVTGALERRRDDEASLRLPSDWETQFSQVSTNSLDQLCFTPCFALFPTDTSAKDSAIHLTDGNGCAEEASLSTTRLSENQLEAKPRSARLRRHAARPKSSAVSSVPFGLASIKTSLKSSLKTSIFRRTAEHHNKAVFMVD